jgi:hypothetical protein
MGQSISHRHLIVIVIVLVLDLLSLRKFDHEQEHEHDYEVAWMRPLATFPARERLVRRVDLLTWSC